LAKPYDLSNQDWSMRKLNVQSIEDIASGAPVLGTGGGGDPYIGKLMAVDAVNECGPITLLDPSEVPDDALVVPTAMMGAPTVALEKIPRGDEAIGTLRALEKRLGAKAFATMSIEAGGLNSTIPLSVAARLGIPMVDADGMGRAFPEIQMFSFHLHGIPATPMAMADEKGNAVLLETISDQWTERLARTITISMGCTAIISLYPSFGRQLKGACVPNTISLAEQIGRLLREAKQKQQDPIRELLKLVQGYSLFNGKVVDVMRRTVAGFARGEAILEGIDRDSGSKLMLRFQNENLVAIKDEKVLASVPDLITLLEIETGLPITTETLRYGYRVVVIGIPCHKVWRTEEGLKLVGPRYFGYDIDYIPIEQRMARRA
jgi:DUF917 family protein